jgi:hypothetical protein
VTDGVHALCLPALHSETALARQSEVRTATETGGPERPEGQPNGRRAVAKGAPVSSEGRSEVRELNPEQGGGLPVVYCSQAIGFGSLSGPRRRQLDTVVTFT